MEFIFLTSRAFNSFTIDKCLEIAIDKSGCCVLQQCVLHAEGEPRERLLAKIIGNALILAEHPYGIVVSSILVMALFPPYPTQYCGEEYSECYASSIAFILAQCCHTAFWVCSITV
ncbi:hypothetical protein LOK49_LG01G03888 [Camellia lanceoleosa]|uniref:Uncharacterized protein n=1 Tax=Camellia lanceoleosa TaxID=1840588 RepID=A0ACC0J4V4_9ERIC|nr:hypothetical protein LOK49_LG01G03888 [Camellia lanceoleosa]